MPSRFNFRIVKKEQESLIHQWIDQDHIKKWLHGKGLLNLLHDLKASFEDVSWGKHWIAYENEIPFAYLVTSEIEEETITLDLFICDLNYLGKGLSLQLIQEFLINHFADKKIVIIDPEATNTRAIHVYKKVGFQIVEEFIANWHPVPHLKMSLNMKDLKLKLKN